MPRNRTAFAILALLILPACLEDPNETPTPCLSGSEPLFNRYEGVSFANTCSSNAQCQVGGCSGEVCAAEAVNSTCEVVPTPRGNFSCQSCACVDSACVWIR